MSVRAAVFSGRGTDGHGQRPCEPTDQHLCNPAQLGHLPDQTWQRRIHRTSMKIAVVLSNFIARPAAATKRGTLGLRRVRLHTAGDHHCLQPGHQDTPDRPYDNGNSVLAVRPPRPTRPSRPRRPDCRHTDCDRGQRRGYRSRAGAGGNRWPLPGARPGTLSARSARRSAGRSRTGPSWPWPECGEPQGSRDSRSMRNPPARVLPGQHQAPPAVRPRGHRRGGSPPRAGGQWTAGVAGALPVPGPFSWTTGAGCRPPQILATCPPLTDSMSL
jgi:hypothetical protein